MKVIAINRSPRKNWNTATMLQSALDGAKASGAEIELINLYDYEYKGCISCLACKRKGFPEVPPRVEYSLTPRAISFLSLVENMIKWAAENMEEIINDRKKNL